MLLNPDDRRPIYVQIMEEVRRMIQVGTVLVHDPLPSARQLAVELRVNPNTVSQAYRELEREGIVYVRRGEGTFVSERSVSAAARRRLAHDVATRAVQDARRSGITSDELLHAIREIEKLDRRAAR